jgi:transposase
MKANVLKIDRESRRRLAVQRVIDGWSQKDVTAFLAVHPVTVSKWVSLHRVGGAEGLRTNPHPGRPPLLPDRVLRRLEELLLGGQPPTAGSTTCGPGAASARSSAETSGSSTTPGTSANC